jgi:hypothetical protein
MGNCHWNPYWTRWTRNVSRNLTADRRSPNSSRWFRRNNTQEPPLNYNNFFYYGILSFMKFYSFCFRPNWNWRLNTDELHSSLQLSCLFYFLLLFVNSIYLRFVDCVRWLNYFLRFYFTVLFTVRHATISKYCDRSNVEGTVVPLEFQSTWWWPSRPKQVVQWRILKSIF